MNDDDDLLLWKVTHAKDGIETVYLVSAKDNHEARRAVSDMLFETQLAHSLPVCDPNDFKQRNEIRRALGSFSVLRFVADPPYKLYTFNANTGEIT